jgi:hypothetical protein
LTRTATEREKLGLIGKKAEVRKPRVDDLSGEPFSFVISMAET